MSHLTPHNDNTSVAIASLPNTGQEDGLQVNLGGILKGLQTSITQLAESSEAQMEALQSLREDLILCSDDEGNDDISGDNTVTGGNTFNVESAVDEVLGTNITNSCDQLTPAKNPDPGKQTSLLDSLTQALTSSKKSLPAIAGKIAELIDSMFVLTEMVKERAEEHLPPENCKYLSVTTNSEEIWDLLSCKTGTVDLAFQRVQEPLIWRLTALANLAGKLVKDITNG